MERAAFLARVERRLARGFPPNLAHPLPGSVRVPEIRYRDDPGDLVATFLAAATRQGAVARRVTTRRELEAALDAALDGVETVALSRDPEPALARDHLARSGRVVLEDAAGAALAEVDAGVTGAAGGIARTGTIVVDASRAGSRTVSLLPPTHVALLSARHIVADPSAWWRHMEDHHPDGPPSQLVFITGPSKSADIELTLTVGVHGPGALVVLVLDGDLA